MGDTLLERFLIGLIAQKEAEIRALEAEIAAYERMLRKLLTPPKEGRGP